MRRVTTGNSGASEGSAGPANSRPILRKKLDGNGSVHIGDSWGTCCADRKRPRECRAVAHRDYLMKGRYPHLKKASFYGFLSNRYSTALVSPDGQVDWLVFPRFDGDAVFCRLLDLVRGGFLGTHPQDSFTVTQRYLDDTLVLETLYDTARGQATVHDFLAIGRSEYWRRIETAIPLVLTCRPTFGFGAVNAAYVLSDQGAVFTNPHGPEGIVLRIIGPHQRMDERDQWLIGPGRIDVVLRYSPVLEREAEELSRPPAYADKVEEITCHYWRQRLTPYDGPWDEAFRRSLLTVRGLTYRTNGALLAAATTSLPEVVGESRQWDYRFVWVRDGAYAAEALLWAGDPVGGRKFLEFMFNTVDLVGKPFEAPFYRVDGTMSKGESELGWLSGYKNSRPVRIGNAASGQLQLDIEGDLLWTLYVYWKMTQDATFIRDYWWAIEALVSWVAQNWDQADASLWEFRGADDYYLHSQVMCWVALRVGAELAREAMADVPLASHWDQAALVLRRRVLARDAQANPKTFAQGAKHPDLDAAILTLPLYGFVSPTDPRFQNTLAALHETLIQDRLVFRYSADNMGTVHYPFTLAGFWLARVYLRLGNLEEADRIISRQLDMTTDLGLFAEHVDPQTGEPHGNFPQLFPHAALITTLMERQAIKGGQVPWTLAPDP